MYGLLFHSVESNPPPFNMSRFSAKKFGRVLDCLKYLGIETITVSQRPSILTQRSSQETSSTKKTPPRKITAITFDDGLLSFYDCAYPLLEDKKIKSTIFIIAGTVGTVGSWDVMGRTRHLDAGMIREIACGGHEIGSHSLTHANLVWLDDGELMKELRESKMILEDITGKSVKSVSFPFGSWNKRVWNAARTAGYEYATAYRGHRAALSIPEITPVFGAYRFDAVADVIDRINIAPGSLPRPLSPLTLSSLTSTRTLTTLMSHFSKGTPICKFRDEYYRRFPC